MNDEDNIKYLLKRIAEGNSDAYKDFYDLFYIKIYRFTGYFVKTDYLKEEIVSDVFFSVWQGRKNLPKVEKIEAYLYTSTRNRALYYQNKKTKENTISIENLPIGYSTLYETPESIVITDELKLAVNAAIAELPERCRIIFLMAKEEELKYKEIAEILSISEKTVNAQMVTALKRLAESLRKYINLFFFGF